MQVVTQNHPSANGATPTRDPDAERGAGRAFRQETDMLPRIRTNLLVQAPGKAWGQSKPFAVNKGVTGRTGSLTVNVRSGNSDPAAVGSNQTNWGIAAIGDAPTAEAPAEGNGKLYLILGGLAVAALFLLKK